uniref:Relaxase protein n=1 Tax=Aeromonas sp. Ne-1 TaxID=1675689 RepID=A0A0H4J9G4_9GAMM|nr:relaxase/mobilization nuclease domain-containing protein [Aeromonas sp. Ne-1]AKO69653.1 relaxase protein [Aeromonas sp. Ne-1]
MATIKLSTTKVGSRLISYAEKRADQREGVNCPAEYAKSQMKATRELWGKEGGIQAHHVIQSFKPGEVSPELANKIGQDLAKEIAPGHECVVYTHTDKDHIHNHIVINSVSYEDGRKFHAHGKEAIEKVREASDRLCKERNLSVVKEPSAEQRYARAEYGLAKRGVVSWKDEIREVIDHEKQIAKNYDEFKKNLTDKYNIEVKERGKNISFRHPDSQKFVRGKTLGLAYERGTIEDGFNRQIEGKTRSSQERGNTDLSSGERAEVQGIGSPHERDQRTERTNEGVHSSSYGQGWDKSNDNRSRADENQNDQSRSSREDDFDFDKARRHAEGLRQSTSESYGKWQERDEQQQSKNASKNERDRGNAEPQHERDREQDIGLDR